MNAQNERSKASKNIQHRSNVISAITTYMTSSCTLETLAHKYNVSGNNIHSWFCQAVAKKYIIKDDFCIKLMQKHVREYEKKHNINNSSLRDMYQRAFEARHQGLTSINVNALLNRKI